MRFSFKKILDKTLDGLQAVEKMWFKNYIAQIVYGSDRKSKASEFIVKENRADFEAEVNVTYAIQLPTKVFRKFLRRSTRPRMVTTSATS
jgi:hypothetical protein